MPSPFIEILAALGATFERVGMRWYLFGAQAALLHGAARLTADVDVTVDLGDRPLATLIVALGSAGFSLRVADVNDFVERTRVLPLVHTDSDIAVDVVLAGPGPEELFFQRVQQRVVEGITLPVASPEDIVVMKVLSGRPKDIEDVEAILAAHPGDLDLGLIRAMLRQLEQALGQSDLVPTFERVMQRARS